MLSLLKKSLLIAAVVILSAFVVGQFFAVEDRKNAAVIIVPNDKGPSQADIDRERELAEKQKRIIEAFKVNEKKQFELFLGKHLSGLKKEEYRSAEQAASELYWKIRGFKSSAKGFAVEISGYAWCFAKNHEIKSCFEKHIFDEHAVNEMIKNAAADFVNKSAVNRARFNEGIISEAKAGHYKYLSEAELNRVAELSLVSYNMNFNGVLGKVEFRDYAFYRGGGFVVSAALDFVLARILTMLATRAAILGTGAAGSWWTFGVSLAAGYVINEYATNQFIKEVESETVACVEKTANDASSVLKNEIISKLSSEFVAVP